jgi:Bacteriophage T4-like portal protein (Gp20)
LSAIPPQTRAQPHRTGWFTNLLSQFQRTQHPAAAELDDDDTDHDLPDGPNQVLDLLKMDADRKKRLSLFDEMDSFGLVSSVLDLYAEESTQPDYDKQRRVWIDSSKSTMVKQGDLCLTNLQIEDRVTGIARRIAKYGDEFRRHIYEAGKGVLGWRSVNAGDVSRIEDRYARLVGFKEDGKTYRQKSRTESWPWDYTHFRLLGKDKDDLYGTSMLEAMFRPWRQLALTEDSMLMYRLRRAPDRNAVFVNVGTMDPTEAAQWLNTYRKKFRKHEFVDPASANYKKQYNPLTPLEDVFLAVRNGDEVRVETLSGSGNIGEVYDLEYFRDAFFGSARVPKAYLGFEGEINAKATLIMQDVRFARGCKRLRSAVIQGIRNTLDIHFVLSGEPGGENSYDPTKAENAYVVQMSPISYLDEFERLELVQLRFQILEAQMRVGTDLQLDTRVWASYILLNYAKLPEELVLRLLTKAEKPVEPPEQAAFEQSLTPKSRELWEALPKQLRDQVLNRTPAPKQTFALSEAEAREVAFLIHRDAKVRKVIGDICYLFAGPDLSEAAQQQVDSSLVPPRTSAGKIVSETVEDAAAKQLAEDLKELTAAAKPEVVS